MTRHNAELLAFMCDARYDNVDVSHAPSHASWYFEHRLAIQVSQHELTHIGDNDLGWGINYAAGCLGTVTLFVFYKWLCTLFVVQQLRDQYTIFCPPQPPSQYIQVKQLKVQSCCKQSTCTTNVAIV